MATTLQYRLKKLLAYDQHSGLFMWNNEVNGNNRMAGKVAGSIDGAGYVQIQIDGKDYKAHRLAWLYMTGALPKEQIDHKDHVRTNNRFDNLREATNQENQKNTSIGKNNNSGIIGVSYNKARNKWTASIGINGKSIQTGRFKYFIQAVAARFDAEIKNGFHVNHGSERGIL